MTDKKPVPPSLAQFALEQLAESGEQAAIDLTVQNVEILRAEIERRDARIVELEKESIKDTKAINDLLASIHELKAQQLSAGVVLPDLIAELKKQADEIAREGHAGWGNTMLLAAEAISAAGVVLPERKEVDDDDPYAWIGERAHNACLDEVERLNPSRAQSVPDGYVMVPVEPTAGMEEAGCQGYMRADGNAWVMHMSSMGHAYKAMLAAAGNKNG